MIERLGISLTRTSLVGLFQRVVRYGIVGVAISLIYSLGVIHLVSQLHMSNATLGSVLTFVAILPLAYAAHRYITFFDAGSDSFQLARFVVTTVAGFLITTVGMYVITNVTKSSYLLAVALNWVVIPPMNFLIYFIWVFRVGRPPFAASRVDDTAQREA